MIDALDRLVLQLTSPAARARLSAGWFFRQGSWYAPFHDHNGQPIPERDWLLEGDPLPEHPEYRDFVTTAFHHEALDNDRDPECLAFGTEFPLRRPLPTAAREDPTGSTH